MHEKLEPTETPKTVAASESRQAGHSGPTASLVDKRPLAIMQRKLIALTSNEPVQALPNSATPTVQRVITTSASSGKARKKELAGIFSTVKGLVSGQVRKGDITAEVTRLDGVGLGPYSMEEAVNQVITNLGLTRKETLSEKASRTGLAEAEKAKAIAPYLALLDHLAGEEDTKSNSVSGGHLLLAMRALWKERLDIEDESGASTTDKWTMKWRLKSSQSYKSSTMFPSGWSSDNLKAALLASEVVGGTVIAKFGGVSIPINKSGGTFYPE